MTASRAILWILRFFAGAIILVVAAFGYVVWAVQSNGGGTGVTDHELPAPFEDAVMLDAAFNDDGASISREPRNSAVYLYALPDDWQALEFPAQRPTLEPARAHWTWRGWFETEVSDDTQRQGCFSEWQRETCRSVEGVYAAGRDRGWFRFSGGHERRIDAAWQAPGSYVTTDGRVLILVVPSDGLIMLADYSW
ncbi:MAG: hypothetical protein AAGF88_08895 [Pseudomonadota bacterium]